MPGRILAFLDKPTYNPPSAPAAPFKNPFATNGASKSTTSLSIERIKEPKVKVKEKKERKDSHERRNSFGMDSLKRLAGNTTPKRQNSGEYQRKQSPKPTPKPEIERAAKIHVDVESPPLLSIGQPTHPEGEESSGALFSSQLHLEVLVPTISVVAYESRLICVVKHHEPVEKRCAECLTKMTELKKWEHITEPRTYKKGKHSIPLGYHFPGHLPATTHTAPLASIEYRLITIAKTSENEEIKNDFELDLKRAIEPGAEKISSRIFPPTNLGLHVTLQPIIHPIGEFPVNMRIEGATDSASDPTSIMRWRLRRVSWRIDETHKMISPACSNHAAKVGGDGKGIQHEQVKTVGQADVKQRWKSDFDEGSIELEFNASVNPNLKPTCDVTAPNGLSVTHALVLELVVAEEWCSKTSKAVYNPTGSARILRTQFNLTLTERLGMGVSWDKETPPMYEDVPISPPGYRRGTASTVPPASPPEYGRGTVNDFNAALLSPYASPIDEQMEHLSLSQEIARPASPQHPDQAPARQHQTFTADDLETAEPEISRSQEIEEEGGVQLDTQAGTVTSE